MKTIKAKLSTTPGSPRKGDTAHVNPGNPGTRRSGEISGRRQAAAAQRRTHGQTPQTSHDHRHPIAGEERGRR